MKNIILVLVAILFGSINIFADGTEPFGDGTELNPYQVTSLDNLLWLSTNNMLQQGVYIIQISDIDASETETWNDGEGFKPIGGWAINEFRGSYDGLNHTISNLYINRPNHYVGLFGKIAYSKIENLTLINANVTGMWQVGALIGQCTFSSTIINCASENGNVSGGSYKVGGLVGEIDGSNGACELLFSYVTGTVFSNSEKVGGLVGYNFNSLIENCFVVMDSIIGNYFVGGLVGYNSNSIINNCNTTAEVFGNNLQIGGLVGQNIYSSTITNCSSEGSVFGKSKVGGLVGLNEHDSYIINCYSTADVAGDQSYIGGFVGGSNNTSAISNCYSTGIVLANSPGGFAGYSDNNYNNFWDTETSGVSNGIGSGNTSGITGKTHEEMLNVATYTDTTTVGLETAWDFLGDPFDDDKYDDIWNIDGATNNGYPFFTDSLMTSISKNEQQHKASLLLNNYPNPFTSSTSILFSIQEQSKVAVIIFNFKGQKIITLANRYYPVGNHTIIWSGTDENNFYVPSGLYFYQLQVNNKLISVKKCILLR